MQETDFVSGFARGLRVIEAFGDMHPRLSIAQAAKLTGLDRATVRRSLLTLHKIGYADYDGKFFTLTPQVLRLGHAYLSATPLPLLVQPYLDRLSDTAGQSASASVLDGAEIVYIARASQKRVMSINLMPGSRLPAYCASMGRVLLAALSPENARQRLESSQLKANTPFTKTDVVTLMAELDLVRRQGYALIDQELEIGLSSIAVGIQDKRGRIIAALNVGAPSNQVPAAKMIELYLPLLLETRDQLKSVLQ